MDAQKLEDSILKHTRSWKTAAELTKQLGLSNYAQRIVTVTLLGLEESKKLEGQIRHTGTRGRPAREFRCKR